ncbi:MAG: DNA methyltransferase [Chloroflexota bacterium]
MRSVEPPAGGADRRQSNGVLNKLRPEDAAAHDWYRFVLSFPPQLVRQYLQRFGLDKRGHVLDPFCGTGTVPVECRKLGIPSIGIEANALAHFAGTVKLDWQPDPEGLLVHARGVAAAARTELERQGIEDEPLFLAEPKTSNGLRSLPPEQFALLLTGSISPLPLHKTLVLLETIEKNQDGRYHGHERLALAKALTYSISNLQFGPEVGVGAAKPDAPVINAWLSNVASMAHDLRTLGCLEACPARVALADSRTLSDVMQPGSVDAVITSPPYPNEKDYTRTTRLESVVLGFLRSKMELRELKHALIRSNSRGVYKGDDDDRWIANDPEIAQIADAIEARRIELGKTSGFERQYARVTKLYFGGMARHLADLRHILRPGAKLAYVVGDQASYLRIMIRTGQILARIGASLGYEICSIDLFRTRLATATREQLREEVVVLRWPG